MQYLIMGAGAAGLCAYTFYRSVLAFLFLLPVAFLYPVYKKKDLEKERIRRLTLQFKEGIMVLASFLSAGYSLENSLSLSVKELEGLYGKTGMITEEFSYMEAGVRMNRPVELLLADMGRRSGIQDVDQFAQVFAAAKRSGGELTDIISQTAGIIRDKIQVQEEIHTLTAARVFEQKIMNGIPFGIILYIDFTSPGFFHVFSNDGKELLYTSENYKGLFLYDLKSKTSDVITEVDGAGYNPAFDRNGEQVYYRATEKVNMRQQNTWMCYQRKEEKNVRCADAATARPLSAQRLGSPMGNTLTAYTDKLCLIVETNGLKNVLHPLEKTDRYLWGSLSPDGNRILFTAVGKGTYVCDLKGKVLAEIGYLNAPVWYDRDRIVGMVDKDNGDYITSSSVVMVSADGKQRQILVPSTEKAMYPAVNRSSGRIAYNTLEGDIIVLELEK